MAKKTSFAGFAPDPLASPDWPRRLAILAFDGVVLGDLATPCEVFGRARSRDGRALYEVRICSMRPRVVSEHVTLEVPWRLSSLRRAHTVVVPGVDDIDRALDPDLLRAIRQAIERGSRVASICTGAFVLAATGALAGKRATTHWLAARELKRRYPDIDVDADVLYVDNGNVLTSAGAAAGLDLCLHLVRRDLGAEAAAEVARAAVMPLERAGGQAQFITPEPAASEGTSLGSLLEWMARNLRKELSLPAIARRAAMSTRTLSRRFREQVGTTPALWVAQARVRRAQRLLETTDLSVERISTEAGFPSALVLRERFRRILGTSPQAYRQAFKVS